MGAKLPNQNVASNNNNQPDQSVGFQAELHDRPVGGASTAYSGAANSGQYSDSGQAQKSSFQYSDARSSDSNNRGVWDS